MTRALEKLHAALAGRGITSSAGALAALLATPPASAAPAGLAAQLATNALAASAAAAPVLGAGGLLTFMIAKKFTLAAAGLAALLATGLVWHQHRQLRTVETALAAAVRQNEQLQARRAARPTPPPATPAAPAVPAFPVDPLVGEAADVVERVAQLKQLLSTRPDQQIPELRLILDVQWIVAASMPRESERELLQVFHNLRNYGKAGFAMALNPALARFAAANQGQLPTDIMQLLPHVDPPVDAAMLQRYQVIRSGRYDDVPPKLSLIGEIGAVPGPFDSVVRASKKNLSVTNVPDPTTGALERAVDAYARAHRGEDPTEAAQLLPFAAQPVDPETLRSFWARRVALPTGQRVQVRP